jgi:predicted RNA polymerase sigma factor
MRRFEEAHTMFDRAIALAPEANLNEWVAARREL